MSEKNILAKECKYYNVEDDSGKVYVTRSPVDMGDVIGMENDLCGDEMGQVISTKPLTKSEILDFVFSDTDNPKIESAKYCREVPTITKQKQNGGFYRYKLECVELP